MPIGPGRFLIALLLKLDSQPSVVSLLLLDLAAAIDDEPHFLAVLHRFCGRALPTKILYLFLVVVEHAPITDNPSHFVLGFICFQKKAKARPSKGSD